jgi:hypothetical protein
VQTVFITLNHSAVFRIRGEQKTCLALFKAMQSDVSLQDFIAGVAAMIHVEPSGLLHRVYYHLVIRDDGKQGVYWTSP